MLGGYDDTNALFSFIQGDLLYAADKSTYRNGKN